MIRLEANAALDQAMTNLVLSMDACNEFIPALLGYTERVLTQQREAEVLALLRRFGIPQTTLQADPSILTGNPYWRDIRFDRVAAGAFSHEAVTIAPRTLLTLDFHQPLGKYLLHYLPVGYFPTPVTLPVLREGKRVWMSPAVSEIRSMQGAVHKGRGHCLALGLGIGFLPYLWLLRDEVESVTVVEFNPEVIGLFERFIRPQFKTAKPLTIIQGDAFDYYHPDFLNRYDYVYADIWESNDDGLVMYSRLMQRGPVLPQVDFWVEDSILYHVKFILAIYLHRVYAGRNLSTFLNKMEGVEQVLGLLIDRYFRGRDYLVRTEEDLLGLIHSKPVLRAILAQPDLGREQRG